MKIDQLITATNEILSLPNHISSMPSMMGVDIRTIRYYQTLGLLSLPKKDNKKEAIYGTLHIKELLVIKGLQSRGYSLSKIASMMKSSNVQTLLVDLGFRNLPIDNSVYGENTGESEMDTNTAMKKAKKKVVVKAKQQPLLRRANGVQNNEEQLKVVPLDNRFVEHAKSFLLGSSFVFVEGLQHPVSNELYRLMYGQKNPHGELTNTVLFVDEKGLKLPGFEVIGRANTNQKAMSVILSDKNMYKEGEGVATLFVFCPGKKNTTVVLEVRLDSAEIDTPSVTLDENGCGITRVSTYAAGHYEVTMREGGNFKCNFDAGKYELAPLSVSLQSMKAGTSDLSLSLDVRKYTFPMNGKVKLYLTTNNQQCTLPIEVDVKDGQASADIDIGTNPGPFSIVVVDSEDANLIAGTPLTGTSKSERESTTVGFMGKVFSASMVPSSNDNEYARGLFFEQDSVSNTPISIAKIIDSELRVDFNTNCDHVVIAVRDPISGGTEVHELGSKKSGERSRIKTASPISMVHVGAFANGNPWEGHSVFILKSDGKLTLQVPERVEPGNRMRLKVKTDSKASVFIKVVDNRLRSAYEPMSAMGSIIKEWADWTVNGARPSSRITGYIDGQAHPRLYSVGRGFTSVMDLVNNNDEVVFGSSYPTGGILRAGPRTKGTGRIFAANLGAPYEGTYTTDYMPSEEEPRAYVSYFSPPGESLSTKNNMMSDGISTGNRYMMLCAGTSSGNGNLSIPVATRLKAPIHIRESVADVIYTDLLTVHGEKEIQINLPDSIGRFDVKAFAVSGANWTEYSKSVTVEKEFYIEPFIPMSIHPEDEVLCRAYIVRPPKDLTVLVKVDGKSVNFDSKIQESGLHLSWKGTPGVHEVFATNGSQSDAVTRIVEEPGEETVLAQRLVILKKGDKIDLSEEGGLALKVLPGMREEVRFNIKAMTDYQHSCCEQTSAKMAAAALGVIINDDKTEVYKSIISGVRRLESMYIPQQKAFAYYLGGSVHSWASDAAAYRGLNMATTLKEVKLPSDVRSAILSLEKMCSAIYNAKTSQISTSPMEAAYHGNSKVSANQIEEVIRVMKTSSNLCHLAEAAYLAAKLIKDGKFDQGLQLANMVAQRMSKNNGQNGWHGTCESLAYMHLVYELDTKGVISGATDKAKIKVDGKVVKVSDAMEMRDISTIESTGDVVAVRLTKIEKLRLDKIEDRTGMSISLKGKKSSAIKSGDLAKIKVKLQGGYVNGDVLCILLPDCLSMVVGGAKVKKCQVDFAGKDEVEVDVVAHAQTEKPQRWFAAVRNMYDSDRIGSVGVLTASVQ